MSNNSARANRFQTRGKLLNLLFIPPYFILVSQSAAASAVLSQMSTTLSQQEHFVIKGIVENNYTQVQIFMLPVVFQDQLVCVLWVRLS